MLFWNFVKWIWWLVLYIYMTKWEEKRYQIYEASYNTPRSYSTIFFRILFLLQDLLNYIYTAFRRHHNQSSVFLIRNVCFSNYRCSRCTGKTFNHQLYIANDEFIMGTFAGSSQCPRHTFYYWNEVSYAMENISSELYE